MTENTVLALGIFISSFLAGGLSGILSRRSGLRLSGMEEAFYGRLTPGDLPGALLLGSFFAAASLVHRGIGPTCLRDWTLSSLLLAVSVADLRKMSIPGRPLIFGILLWLLWLAAGGLFSGMDARSACLSGLVSAVLFSGILLVLSVSMDRIFRKETLGGGDLRLIFVVMLHLGFARGILCLVLCLAAGFIFVLARKDRRIPFAPSIAIGTLISLLSGALLSGGVLRFSG